MTSAFSTSDGECLNRNTMHDIDIINLEDIWNDERLNECVSWIRENHFQKVSIKCSTTTTKRVNNKADLFGVYSKGVPTISRQFDIIQHKNS